MTRVDICICTYRRAHLAETLASVARIDPAGASIRVIVSDNDVTPSAQTMVNAVARDYPFPIQYLHSPAGNISIARNGCLDAADADYLAFVDDDETVTEHWLAALLTTAQREDAAAVLGPVHASYLPGAPAWMAEGEFHSTFPVFVNGAIETGYTCNALIRWTAPFNTLRFDLALGKSGGEDNSFFYALTALGGRITYAPDAIVSEVVPADRADMGWLLRRRYRFGQTHGAQLAGSLPANLKSASIAAAKACACGAMTLVSLPSPARWRKNLLRGVLHLGVVGGLFGVRQADHYGQATKGNQSHA